MKRYLYILLFIILNALTAFSQIKVSAPSHVAVGEQFRLQYTVNTTEVKGFRCGSVPEAGFEVLMGPSTSTQQSFQIINGHTSSSSSVTYTYILSAVKNGTYTIGPAHANVNGKTETSSAVKIVVSGHAQSQQGGGQSNMQQQRGAQVRQAGSRISGNDLFIKVSANKQRVHEQEPILLTYKVFTQVELTQLEGKMPDLNGFHTQEIPLPQQKSFHIENVNGRPYRCVTWSEYVMYPQMTGKLVIPSITFKGIVVQENTNVDPFEAFFNGGSGYVEVKKDIQAPSVTIQVDPLPTKPANFSGGVGQFTFSANLDKKTVKAGDPVNVRMVIGGSGNLKLVKQPEIVLPKDFDKYDPKVTDKTQLTTSGLSGNMIYDQLVVPRHQGKYTIQPIELVYFDTRTSSYKTIKTQPLEIEVTPGDGKTGDVADYSQKEDNDIHAIHDDTLSLGKAGEYFFGSTAYTIINALIVIAFIVLLIIFRKRAMERANVAGMRGKKANSVASKRLKKAAKFMSDGKSGEFYDEVLRAMWGYVGDKFSMPVTDLSRDNIAEVLQQKDVEENVINSLIQAIDECEFERYAPGDAAGNMQKTYDTAVSAITNIEDAMKQKKAKSKQTRSKDNYLRIITLLFMIGGMFACSLKMNAKAKTPEQMKVEADSAYNKGNYQQAIALYEDILKQGVSADVYYNLGNAYYRSDNITKAIIAYEHAHKLAPGNDDINHNLKIARSKTIDALQPTDRMVFAEWYDKVCNMYGVDGWAHIALWSLVIALVLFLVYLFVNNPVVQRLSFYVSVVLIVLFVFGNIFAYQQKATAEEESVAIVTAPSTNVRKTPTVQGVETCVIHEGTRLEILDATMKDWLQVRLPDGREGWIPANTIVKI